jgi:hypothetical protein
MRNPWIIFLILLIIGVIAGLLVDRFAGPGWLSRQIGGKTRTVATSALVGIAGSFVAYDLAALLRITGWGALIAAAVGALALVWGWRLLK